MSICFVLLLLNGLFRCIHFDQRFRWRFWKCGHCFHGKQRCFHITTDLHQDAHGEFTKFIRLMFGTNVLKKFLHVCVTGCCTGVVVGSVS